MIMRDLWWADMPSQPTRILLLCFLQNKKIDASSYKATMLYQIMRFKIIPN